MSHRNRNKSSVNGPALFDQAYWVVPGKLMAGCYPGSEEPQEALIKLENLLNQGIHHIISLMEPNEVNRFGKPFVPYDDRIERLAAASRRITIDRMSIKDMGIPARSEMRRILDRIDGSIRRNKTVYIHCLGGIGRTGTVVGCYLARHGYASGQGLLQLIRELRKNTVTRHQVSPETDRQIELVRSWALGE